MDQERQELLRRIAAGEVELDEKVRILNERAGPTIDDINYLQEYLKICNAVLGYEYDEVPAGEKRRINLAEGLVRLSDLNEKYGTKVGASVFKEKLFIRSGLFYGEDTEFSNRCIKAKRAAKADDVEANRIGTCGNKECKVCDSVSDGWVPSEVC